MCKDVNKIIFLIAMALTIKVEAAERYEFFTGIRQMGMGGASIAVVNDETALLVNPAGLGKLREHYITVVDPEFSFSENNAQIFKGGSFSGFSGPQGILDNLNRNKDKHFHMQGQVFPSFVIPNFGFGLLINYRYNAEVVDPNFNVNYHNDYAAVVGYNFRLFDGRIKLGFSTRLMNRVEVDESLPSNSANLEWEPYVKEGGAIALQAGILLTAPWDYLPTLAAVVNDIGGTRFDMGAGMVFGTPNKPEAVPETIDVAFSLSPIVGKRTRMQITGELRDLTEEAEPNSTDSARRYHAGVEWNFSDMFFLRAGMNQRYWTAGIELAFENLQFQLASYGEEIGDNTTTREDRRYMWKVAFRF